MNEIKTVVNIPWAGHQQYGNRLQNETQAYSKVPIIYRALKMRCDSLCRVPHYFYDEQDNEVDYIFEEQMPFSKLLWLSEASFLLRGTAYLLKLKNEFQLQNLVEGAKGLQWLNPLTIQTEYNNGRMRIWQQLPDRKRFPKQGYWSIDDFVYIDDFDPNLGDGLPVSACQLALGDATTAKSVTAFLSDFFSADALPVTMIMMPSGTGDAERDRVESWFKKKLAGMRNKVARVLGVSGEIKVEKLTSDLNTFDIAGIDAHVVQGVSDAFGIPQSLLRSSSGANRAISDNERRCYLLDTVIPQTKRYEAELNDFLKDFGQRVEFCPEELDEMQEDEAQRADSVSKLVSAGVPLLAAFDILGYDLSEEAEALIEEAEAKKQEVPQVAIDPTMMEQKAELDRWQRKSLNRLKDGKTANVEFESNILNDELKREVNSKLATAKTEEEVKTIFKTIGSV